MQSLAYNKVCLSSQLCTNTKSNSGLTTRNPNSSKMDMMYNSQSLRSIIRETSSPQAERWSLLHTCADVLFSTAL